MLFFVCFRYHLQYLQLNVHHVPCRGDGNNASQGQEVLNQILVREGTTRTGNDFSMNNNSYRPRKCQLGPDQCLLNKQYCSLNDNPYRPRKRHLGPDQCLYGQIVMLIEQQSIIPKKVSMWTGPVSLWTNKKELLTKLQHADLSADIETVTQHIRRTQFLDLRCLALKEKT